MEDLTGKQFHNWTVLGRSPVADKYRSYKWICKCTCGTIKEVAASSLRSGDSKSCGCHKANRLNRNLIGQRYGRWIVIDYANYIVNNSRRWRAWLCKCDCGTIRAVTESSLIAGKTTSCGCYRKEQIAKKNIRESLIGKRFGNLVVLKELPSKKYKKGGYAQMWLCQCDCGNIHVASGNLMKSGLVRSCGCTKESILESDTKMILAQLNIEYKQQYYFNDLVGEHNGYLLFDFVIFSNNKICGAIECQGEQHYRPVKWFGGVERFKTQQLHDMLKRKYCESHQYPLLEISYKCYNVGLIRRRLVPFVNKICSIDEEL